MCLFHFSTCFEQHSAHHQENKLYQYTIWYISLCVVGHLVCRSERNSDLHTICPPTQSDIYQMMYWYNLFSWWWALFCSNHVEKWDTIKKCVKLDINTNCTEMHGQQNRKKLVIITKFIRYARNILDVTFIGEVVRSEMVKMRECYIYSTGKIFRIASCSNFSLSFFCSKKCLKIWQSIGGSFNNLCNIEFPTYA